MAKNKVKSHARRTKSGIARVTGHSRKSEKSKRNRNIAIGLGIGTSVLALGLGAKHLAKKKGLKGNAPSKPKIGNTTPPQAVSFTPTTSPPSAPKPKVETPSATVAEVRQTTQDVVTKAKEIKPNPSPSPNPSTITLMGKASELTGKKLDNTMKVMERRNVLMNVTPVDDALMRPYFGADARLNPNRQLRKKNAKRLADAARDLRSRDMYPGGPKPTPKSKVETPSATRQTTQDVVNKAKEIKSDSLTPPASKPTPKVESGKTLDKRKKTENPKTNKFLDSALKGQGYQPQPKAKAKIGVGSDGLNVIERAERLRKWDAKRGVVLRRRRQLEDSLGKKVVDKTKGRLDFNPTPRSRKARKKAAKQVAAEARCLRELGEY
jgi:hypothetical protein